MNTPVQSYLEFVSQEDNGQIVFHAPRAQFNGRKVQEVAPVSGLRNINYRASVIALTVSTLALLSGSVAYGTYKDQCNTSPDNCNETQRDVSLAFLLIGGSLQVCNCGYLLLKPFWNAQRIYQFS